jgi:hypothetical protein
MGFELTLVGIGSDCTGQGIQENSKDIPFIDDLQIFLLIYHQAKCVIQNILLLISNVYLSDKFSIYILSLICFTWNGLLIVEIYYDKTNQQ